jgi:hypothetical protein
MAARMHIKPTTRGPAGPARGPGGGGGFGGASSNKSQQHSISIRMIFSHIILGTCCFFGGLMAGLSATYNTPSVVRPLQCPMCPKVPPPGSLLSKAEARRKQQQQQEGQPGKEDDELSDVAVPPPTFPDSLRQMVVDYSTIPRDDFNNHFDIGVPIDNTVSGAEEVLLLHMGKETLPETQSTSTTNSHSLPADQATENCDVMKVILHQPARHGSRQCIAIVPQWESYYVHKFMRLPQANNRPLDVSVPLRYVSRAHSEKGTYQRVPDQKTHTKVYYSVLQEYLENLDRLLELLTPLAQSVADPKTKTIVVLVCNYGQAELFHNFVCNARARGLDLSHMIMFATDEETLQLCQALGITAFYDESIFGSMPTSAARTYGDRTFGKMMMAKVFCVHLINSLGYNLIFQDVDVVWHRNPLPYFEQAWIKEEWDLMFQDDGARSQRYAPFSPNTGMWSCVVCDVLLVVVCTSWEAPKTTESRLQGAIAFGSVLVSS